MIDYAIFMTPTGARGLTPPTPLMNLAKIFDRAGLTVFASAATPCAPIGDHGLILGTLFERGRVEPVRGPLPHDLATAVVRSGGEVLLRETWGGYIAVLQDPASGAVRVLRDPSGAAPAYRLEHRGAQVICSRLELALAAGCERPRLDWASVRRLATFPNLRDAQTGLRGVTELLPGTRIEIEAGGASCIEMAWSPWTFAAREAEINDYALSVELLRDSVDLAVRGWCGQAAPLVLELSGGLDSSIIAVNVDPATRATLVNFVTPTPEGDERGYAQAVARAVGRPLIEQPASGSAVDVTRARPGLHPRPAAQALLQPIDDAFAAIGVRDKSGAFVSGLGGDNVFCALSSAGPAADALMAFGPGPRALTVFRELRHRHKATTWAAARATIKKALMSPTRLESRSIPTFLAEGSVSAPLHPWAEGAGRARPGKRDHVASILVAQGFLDRYDHARIAPVLFPLLAQPVLEACLRIPTWMANQGGRNRAVARDAFADRLPASVRDRQTKGGLNAFMGEAFESNRERLVGQLVKGWLASAGVVDPHSIDRALKDPSPKGEDMARLFMLADIEAWARTWPLRDDPTGVP